MFIRFRQRRERLYISVVESHRVKGVVRQRNVSTLGVVAVGDTATARGLVWRELHEVVGRLGVNGDDAARLMETLQSRVPYPTEVELGSDELRQAEHDAKFWDRIHGSTQKLIGDHHSLIATAQDKISDLERDAHREKASAEAARAKAARLANYRNG
jgi:hypothetical protein